MNIKSAPLGPLQACWRPRIFGFSLVTTLVMGCVGQPPVPVEAEFVLDEDTSLSEELSLEFGTASDAVFSLESAPASGSAVLDASGKLVYTPDQDANGQDSLVVHFASGAETTRAHISLSIRPIDDAPQARIGELVVDSGSTISGVVEAVDADGDILSFEIVSQPSQGTLSAFDPLSGAFTYTPNSTYDGTDLFEFVATDESLSSESAPFHFTVHAKLNVPLGMGVEAPATLSETGIFQGPEADLVPNADLISYTVNQQLWTDWAIKSRYLFVPAGQTVDFDPEEPFSFPTGSFLVKHFQMETSASVLRNVETRLLIAKQDAATGEQIWVGYVYQWNEEGDADLVPEETSSRRFNISVDATAKGGAREQLYAIPSRAQCQTCHNAGVGFARSFRAANLSRQVAGENQLTKLDNLGLFSAPIPDPSTVAAYSSITDTSASPEERVRSYLSVNCSHCHTPGGAAFLGFDLNYSAWNEPAGLSHMLDSGVLNAGDPGASRLYQRMLSASMPVIGSNLVDEKAMSVIDEFIRGLSTPYLFSPPSGCDELLRLP